METKEAFTKQCNKNEERRERGGRAAVESSRRPKRDIVHTFRPYPAASPQMYEEPIDLTYTQRSNAFFKYDAPASPANYPQNVLEPFAYQQQACRPRRRRSRIYRHQNLSDNKPLQTLMKDVIELQTTESKQDEIIKAAKSLFSKRTRTLYHWIYPNTPKQQIKAAVANSWDTLSGAEKQFYISQVLVRFGFGQCDLMVNPQLGGIKELLPLPDTMDGGCELQAAISSISAEPAAEGRKRQGRPPGSKNKRAGKGEALRTDRDFQDDPELSRELERFDIVFDQA